MNLIRSGVLLVFATGVVIAVAVRGGKGAHDDHQFENEIVAFEQQDLKNPPEKGGIVFVGSSSIRLWKSLKEDFPGRNVLNRGFGGSQIADSVHYATRIVTKYEPKKVVFFAGTNDLHAGKKAENVLADFSSFVDIVHSKLPKTPIAFIAITPSPSRFANLAEIKKANELVKAFCRNAKNMVYIDTFNQYLNADGGPRPDLFITDQLHMNPEGYKIWAKAVAPFVYGKVKGEPKKVRREKAPQLLTF